MLIPPRQSRALPLHEAASRGNTEALKGLLEQGASVDDEDTGGSTPIFTAAANSFSNSIRLLAKAHADVNRGNKEGDTPLHKASENGHTRAIVALMDNGSNIHQRNRKGETALHLAAINNHGDAVRLLLAMGASHTIKTNSGLDVKAVAKKYHSSAALEAIQEHEAKKTFFYKLKKKLFGTKKRKR